MSRKSSEESTASGRYSFGILPDEEKLQDIMQFLPCGFLCGHMEEERLIAHFYSDEIMTISGFERQELEELMKQDAFELICREDFPYVFAAVTSCFTEGEEADVEFRIRCKDFSLKWCRLKGRRRITASGEPLFVGIFVAMTAESQLLRGIASETADGIYVISREDYKLLYLHESKTLFGDAPHRTGETCYEVIHGKTAPCEFCTLNSHAAGGAAHDMPVKENGRFYSTSFKEILWKGVPAYVKYVRDVTEDVLNRQEKERLEQYFQTVLQHLHGGVAVVRHHADGTMVPEFLSEGFAKMVEMDHDEVWALYKKNALTGVHPEDRNYVSDNIAECLAMGEEHRELTYRLQRGTGGYIWIKADISVIPGNNGDMRVYVDYRDITEERAEKEQLRQQYEARILQHYRTDNPDVLVLGHCNITHNKILEVMDHTGMGLLETFGSEREKFFEGIGSLVVREEERQEFLNTYLNAPSMAAFRRGETVLLRRFFVKIPGESVGRYLEFKVNLVEMPDTEDIVGILTVTDITEETVRDRLMHQLTLASYDIVADVDLLKDQYTIVGGIAPEEMAASGSHSEQMHHLLNEQMVPRDREQAAEKTDNAYIMERLKKEGTYYLSYSIISPQGDILTKNLTISEVDLELGRVCFARTDITDSVREQQGLLNMIAYTFDLACFVDLGTGRLTMYTRSTVLENLPPYRVENYDQVVDQLVVRYSSGEIAEQFKLETILQRLKESPSGYDFVIPFQEEEETRYKQVNVLWGDESRRTVCMVRADVTDVLAAERESQRELAEALAFAKQANRAKSDFLASMSHDIRTPMNAIMGMTSLALSHLDDQKRTGEYLQKIAVSSRHLLSLINDVLDMSQIEQAKIHLNRMLVSMEDLVEQIQTIMTAQARNAGLSFRISVGELSAPWFWGDGLRINQILINILGNAMKFTPEGGSVFFGIEEMQASKPEKFVRYRFTVQDTGVGMSREFQEELFEAFTRSRDSSKVEGTGLGLSITKGLIDLMGGTIRVESAPSKGSTFFIELECEKADEEDETEKQKDSAHYNKKDSSGLALQDRNFLVAEDNAINSEILCELLQMRGAKTVVRENGYLAVQAFENAAPGTFDAILMDIQMPEMNGLEAARAIRSLKRPDAARIPIIAMTANAFAEDVQASLEAGMNAHVAKPIDMRILCATLSRELEKQGRGIL